MMRGGLLAIAFLLVVSSMALTMGFNQAYMAQSPSEATINESFRENATDIDWSEPPSNPAVDVPTNPLPGVDSDGAPPKPLRGVVEWLLNVTLLASDAVARWGYANKEWLPLPVARAVSVAPMFAALGLAGYRVSRVFSR